MHMFLYSTVGYRCQHCTPTDRSITNLRQNAHPFKGYFEKGHSDDMFVPTRLKYHKSLNSITNYMKIKDGNFNIVFENNIKFGVSIRFSCFIKTPFTCLVSFCHHKLNYHKNTNIITNQIKINNINVHIVFELNMKFGVLI